ncbi:MAG: hypothetical protein NTW29_19360, partial [Bacteroidetes bacterium]|nr:hypothetical protein [Bacteroidota bacterium]
MKNTLITLLFVLASVAASAQSPGGVNPGGTLKFWVKADAGLNVSGSSVTGWVNQADNTKNMIPSGSPAPVLAGTANYINFNPTVNFLTTAPGTGTLYTVANILPANSNYSRFVVFNANPAMTGFANIIGSGSPAPPATSSISFLKNAGTNTVGQWFGSSYFGGQASYTPGVAEIGTSVLNSGVANGSYININGTTGTATTLSGIFYAAINVQLGAAYNVGGVANVNFYYGYMPEVIVYSSALTATEVKQVESYLAIKYGKTIAGNYLSSIGATIWTGGAGYQNNIAGIGRDDNSALLQKQSKSENSGFQPIIAVGSIATTNALNNSTALSAADRSFLIWGDDNASTAFSTAISLSGFNSRMARVWKVQETGTVGSVLIAIPASAIPASMTNLSLLRSTSAAFSSGVTSFPLTLQTINGSNYYTTTVDFTTGDFFTFGGLMTAPGGVNTNLIRWYKADMGVTTVSGDVSQWDDQASGVNATQPSVTNRPSYSTSGNFLVNFNPSLTFGNSSAPDNLIFSEAGVPTGTATRAIFGVGAGSASSTTGGVFVSQGTGVAPNFYGLSRTGGTPNGRLNLYGSTLVTANTIFANRVPAVVYGGGPSGSLKLSYNGNPAITNSSVSNSTPTGSVYIGDYATGLSPSWDGDITEVIYYTAEPTAADKQRIDAYLGLKYGVTLASDYLASDGLTFPWKLADHTGYNNNIAGIGRDDNTALNQKQSKSSNTGNHVVFSLDKLATTSGANSGSFTNDLQFLVWGDNGAAGTSAFSTAPYTNRVNRVWKAVNTGGINQTLQVLVPTALFPASARTALLYNTNSSFATGNMLFASTKTVSINGTYYFSYSLPAAQVNTGTFYISFVYYQTAPGGVLGESVWLRADAQGYGDGISLDASKEWIATTGLSAGQYEAQYTTGGVKPVFKKGIWNFNPVVRFNLGGIGTDYANTGSAITTFTTVNNFGASTGQGSPTPGEVRVLSMSGGTSADFGPGTGGVIPVIGGNPLRAITNGSATIVNFATALNGTNPGIATTMRTGPTAASGNAVNRLHAQWNGSAALTTASSVVYNIDYYALGGLADGSKTIRNTNSMFEGDIPEVIVYNTDLTATERQRVNSYLSLKYGVTLNQASAQNYLASDGTTVYWNASGAHATFKNNIAGIGMDNFTNLLQKQGQSIHKPGQVVVSLGTVAATNEDNTGTFSADKQFLVWGDDNASTSATTAVSGFGTVHLRMLRKWELQNTGSFNQQVTVYYPTDTLAVAFGSNQYNLIYDNDATFNGTAKTSVLAGGSITINGINYTSFTVTYPATGTLYFSFGTSNPAPMLTVGAAVCSGTGTYSFAFNSNGTVTASAGTVSGNRVTGIPVGTNVTITSTLGVATTTAVVPSPTSCPSTNGCTPPALTAGQGVCDGTGYSVVFSATSGANISISSGTLSGNTVTGVTLGTSLTITATLGGCSSVVTVNSPVDCSTACATPAASFSAGACAGATYSVNFVKTSGSVVTASTGTVTGGGSGSTSGTISGVATGTAIIATVTEGLCSVQNITINAPSNTAPVLTASNAVCSGAGTYSVTFNSNGIVTASAGTVSGNS